MCISDRIILLRLVIGKAVFTFLSMYAPQSGLPEAVKEHFYDQLQSTVTKVPATEIPILVGDWNGHVGADAGAYNEVHGGHGFGARNSEGRESWNLPLPMTFLLVTPCSRKGTHISSLTALGTSGPRSTTSFTERVSEVQSVM